MEARNAINLFDLNISAEDFYKELLNRVYSLDFVNINTEEPNSKAIDLGDKTARQAIQVTSDNSIGKIRSTVEKFIEAKLHNEYDKLTILMLKKKKAYRELPAPSCVALRVCDHLDLVRDIKRNVQSVGQLESLVGFLDDELVTKPQKRSTADAEILNTFADNASRYIAEVAEHIVRERKGGVPSLDLDNNELLGKFRRMKCSASYKRKFDRHAVFFHAVNDIIATDAVAGGAATIRAIVGLIQCIYFDVLDQSINGDRIHNEILRMLLSPGNCSPEETTAADTLIFYTINECGIFNETK